MNKKILIFLLLFIPFIASASVGISLLTFRAIDLGEIKRNQTYNLGTMNFCNVGDQAGEFEIKIIYLEQEGKKEVPEEWITYDQTEFYLEPNQCALTYGELKILPRYEKKIKGDYETIIAVCTRGNTNLCVGKWLRFGTCNPNALAELEKNNIKKHE